MSRYTIAPRSIPSRLQLDLKVQLVCIVKSPTVHSTMATDGEQIFKDQPTFFFKTTFGSISDQLELESISARISHSTIMLLLI